MSAPETASSKPARTWRRRVLRWLCLAAGSYFGVILLLLALENFLLFHPVKASADWWPPPNTHVQDVTFTSTDGTRLHGWWCPKEGAEGAVLYCHGNAGNLSYRASSVAMWQSELNQEVFIFDYPGYGKSEGNPSEAGCYAAGEAAYEWLTQVQKVPADKLLIYGGSLGGGVAVELATHRPHRALVLCKTFTSIPDMAQTLYPWLPARWLVRTQFNSLEKIARCPAPVFIAHGDCDTLVPFRQGQRLLDAAPQPKEFLGMPGCDHNTPTGPEFFAHLRAFLSRVESRVH